MISVNQSCNRQCKDCKIYNICSLRHIVPLEQEQMSNNLNHGATTKENLFEDPEDMWLPEDIWLNEFRIELANALAKKGFDVYKASEVGADRFVVMAKLPTGRISKHYEMKDWDKFQIPEKEFADKQNEHSPRDVAGRLTILQRIRRLIYKERL